MTFLSESEQRRVQQNCNHSATIKHSVSLDIDKCIQCEGYLVWNHDVPDRVKWVFKGNLEEAIKLAQQLKIG